jgi:hypothetical protein
VYIEILPLSVFYDWMKMKGKEGGAFKFPRVLNETQRVEWETHIAKLIPQEMPNQTKQT